MKKRSFHTMEEADQFMVDLCQSAKFAIDRLGDQVDKNTGIDVLANIKFKPIGCDPLDTDRPLNLIEQVNQTFTYLATIRAIKKLMVLHPDLLPFTVNLGTTSGSDIECGNDVLAAEVFAAVNTTNNKKLAKDRQKVSQTKAKHKYVFFMCPDIGPGRMQQLEREPDVEVWSVGGDT